ncbi:MAG: flavodoxin family protein [Planctomycetota bacterium]|jgi:flavodoxin
MKVLILYYTKTGHTLEAVNAAAEGIRSAGSEADLVAVDDFKSDIISDYDGLIVGSPCWAGSLALGGVATPVVDLLKSLPENSLSGKRCGSIAVHMLTGGKKTIHSIHKLLIKKGCENFRPGPAAKAGTPMSLWKGPSVKPEDEEKFRSYGAEFVG